MPKSLLKTILLSGLFLLSRQLFAQSPGGIINPSFWLQGNFSPEPAKLATLNFNPAMVIDEETRIRLPQDLQSLKRVTTFTVYQNSVTHDDTLVWEMNGGFGDISLSTKKVSSKSRKTALVFATNKQEPGKPEALINTYLLYNNAIFASEEAEPTEGSVTFGNLHSLSVKDIMPGLVAEYILYDRILNEEEITKVESYLALKYSITLEKNYLNASGSTVWDYKNDKRYSVNIAGVARDDQSTLYQKQATSSNAPGQLTIGIDKIAESNTKNPGKITDKDFLVWGDNGQDFTFLQDAETIRIETVLLEKKWMIKSSGRNAAIPTGLKINTCELHTACFRKENFCLVIDRSGLGLFAPEKCEYIMPDSIGADGIASFSSIVWDVDGSGKDIFTFGLKKNVKAVESKNSVSVSSFQIYPNPVTDGHYKLDIKLNKSSDIEIQIFDQYQHMVDSWKGSGLSSYLFSGAIRSAAGSYTVRLLTADTEVHRILILQ